MMKRSIVMTSDPFAMPVRGKGDRTAPIGPENRDAVSRQPLEDLGGGVPVVVVPTDADHGLARRELVQPLVRRRGPRPVMTDLQEVDAPHLPGQPAFHRQPRVGLEQEPDRAVPHPPPRITLRRPWAAIDHDPAAVGRPEGRGVPLPYIEKMYR